jgi:hypothetical protein
LRFRDRRRSGGGDRHCRSRSQAAPAEIAAATVLAFLKKAGDLRRRKVENCKAFVLEQPLSLLNQ